MHFAVKDCEGSPHWSDETRPPSKASLGAKSAQRSSAVSSYAGEVIVGGKKVLCMDEISTGLDSATTFLITKCLSNFCHMMEGTLLVALLQPPPETYNLFDDILLLSHGQTVFHGPREEVSAT